MRRRGNFWPNFRIYYERVIEKQLSEKCQFSDRTPNFNFRRRIISRETVPSKQTPDSTQQKNSGKSVPESAIFSLSNGTIPDQEIHCLFFKGSQKQRSNAFFKNGKKKVESFIRKTPKNFRRKQFFAFFSKTTRVTRDAKKIIGQRKFFRIE